MAQAKRGRPRAFSKALALENALHVFLEKGYEGASLDDLTQAMGVNKPSLYAAFGNKEELFIAVLNFYTAPNQQALRELLFSENQTEKAFQCVFDMMAKKFIDNKNCMQKMGGCLLANSTILSCREDRLSVELKKHHDRNEEIFFERLQLGVQQGDIAAEKDLRALAQYFSGLFQGMAILARVQQSETAVNNIAKQAVLILKSH